MRCPFCGKDDTQVKDSRASDDGGSIIPLFNSYVSANSKAIAHNEIAANWDSDGAKCVERWWFA